MVNDQLKMKKAESSKPIASLEPLNVIIFIWTLRDPTQLMEFLWTIKMHLQSQTQVSEFQVTNLVPVAQSNGNHDFSGPNFRMIKSETTG